MDEPSPRRNYFQTLIMAIGFVGPMIGMFTLMSGSLVLFVPITIGSCLVAGLLCAVRYEGRAGAFFALLVPLIWAVAIPVVAVGAVADGSFAIGDFLAALALGVGFVLFIAACTEVGYLAGRFVARLMRGRSGACG